MKTSTATSVAPARCLRRGVSLIEALVAMAIMAFGMMGVLGMQATLRANSDLSKQRSEATRLAQEKIEAWRSFSVLPATTGVKAYADISTAGVETLSSFISNTTYTRTATVTESSPVGHKTLVVDVSWADRSGVQHNVRLFSVAARLSPDLAATMVVAPQGAGGVREPEGRRRGIPPQAKNFGDGTSGFRPPQAASPTATVWVFNNVTGVITSVCQTAVGTNSALSLANITSCDSTQKYQLISGFLRFHTTGVQATAAGLSNPPSQVDPLTVQAEVAQTAPVTTGAVCFHGDDPLTTPPVYRAYFCAVPVDISTTPQLTWAGALQVNVVSLGARAMTGVGDTNANHRRVCRYRAAATYALADTTGPLANQNLVLMEAPFSCTTTPVVAWQHQP